jgi:transcriptional regulator with XRE-family HTH domain
MANKRAPKEGRRCADIGERLELIREALEFSGAQMAEALHIGEVTWSQYQSGSRQITVDNAIRLCDISNALLRHPGRLKVTLDFIYRGLVYSKRKKEGDVLVRYRIKPRSHDKSEKKT